jgi:hypothetical protein
MLGEPLDDLHRAKHPELDRNEARERWGGRARSHLAARYLQDQTDKSKHDRGADRAGPVGVAGPRKHPMTLVGPEVRDPVSELVPGNGCSRGRGNKDADATRCSS